MSAVQREATITERDAILRERAAYREGFNRCCWRDPATHDAAEQRVESEIRARYPLPRVTRPRVVTDASGTRWRIGPVGAVEFGDLGTWLHFSRYADGEMRFYPPIDLEHVALWGDLFARPTEEVADD